MTKLEFRRKKPKLLLKITVLWLTAVKFSYLAEISLKKSYVGFFITRGAENVI